jgi:hypothetical protein
MLLGTRIKATYFAFQFSAETKRIHQKACKSTWISSFIQRNGNEEARWSVSICGESSGLGWCYVKCRKEIMN